MLSVAVVIIPRMQSDYHMLELSLPNHLLLTVNFFRLFLETWYIWLIVLAVPWLLFESKCRSDYKSTIRLAGGAVVSLAMMVLVCLILASVVLPLVRLPWLIRTRQTDSAVFSKVEEVDVLFGQVAKAADAEDWPAARESARRLRWEFQYLASFGSTAPILASMDRRSGIEDIRRLVPEIADFSDDVADSIRDADHPELVVLHYFSQLQNSYEELQAKVPEWPRGR